MEEFDTIVGGNFLDSKFWDAVKQQGKKTDFKNLAESLTNTAELVFSGPNDETVELILIPDSYCRMGGELDSLVINCIVKVDGEQVFEKNYGCNKLLSKVGVANLAVKAVEDAYKEVIPDLREKPTPTPSD